VALPAALQTGTEAGLARGAGEKAFRQRAEVEASSAGDDGQTASLGDGLERGARLSAILARGKGLGGIGYVDQVMGQEGALFSSGLGRAQVHAAIDGHRVATDDLATELLAEGEGESGLAAAGGAEEQNG
jgi:hypothetical protein